MAPTLLSTKFSCMLMNAPHVRDTGFPIRYCFDGKIFNQRMLQGKLKVQTAVLDELQPTHMESSTINQHCKYSKAEKC